MGAAGINPRRHYIEHGQSEGRFPNARVEPPEVWTGRFDASWYKARNRDLGAYATEPLEHFRHRGILEGRAPNAMEEPRDHWRDIFDPEWYLERNPDVKALGADPLEHYLSYGILEHRRANADQQTHSRPVEAARIERVRDGEIGDETAVFVTFAPGGVIKPHVEVYLRALKHQGLSIVALVASDAPLDTDADSALSVCDIVYHRENIGFDFAAWAHALRLHPRILEGRLLLLVNDSIFGPTSPDALSRMMSRIRLSKAAFRRPH